MTTPARFLAYPLVMLSGAVIGGTFLSVHSPFNQAEASVRPQQPPAPAPPPFRGRLGAETPELHELRMAEAVMFPKGYDRDLSAPELWDPTAQSSGARNVSSLYQGRRGFGGIGRLAAEPDFLKGLSLPNIPVRRDPTVAKYIRYFTTSAKGRRMLTTWLRRSGRYRQLIHNALRKHEVPSDIESVVFIESGFWPTARSTAGAVGLWQFMPKTARIYGLTVDKSVDERRSIWKSTEAAAQYFSDLHDRLQSWDLALAAFNMGYNRLSNVIAAQGTNDYWTLRSIDGALPRETRLYVPKVLAIAVIIHNLKHFDLDGIEEAPPLDAAKIEVPPGIRMSLLARAAGTSLRNLRAMNPEIRLNTTPDRGGPVTIHIPAKGLARARVMLPRLLADQGDDPLDMKVSPDFDWGTNENVDQSGKGRLDRGSQGNGLGLQKKPTAQTTYDFSGLGKPTPVAKDPAPTKAGGFSLLPSTTGSPVAAKALDPVPTFSLASAQSSPSVEPISHIVGATRIAYRVQPGDSAWALSQVWGVPLSRLVRENHLANPDLLPVGRLLKLDIPPFREKFRK